MRQPPVTPPEVPTLASYPASGAPASEDGRGDLVQKLVFTLEQGVDSLAQIAPGVADLADQVKGLLRQALVQAAASPQPAAPLSPAPAVGQAPVAAGRP